MTQRSAAGARIANHRVEHRVAEGTNEVVVHAYCLRMLTVLIMPWLESRLDASLLAEERDRDGAEFVAHQS